MSPFENIIRDDNKKEITITRYSRIIVLIRIPKILDNLKDVWYAA